MIFLVIWNVIVFAIYGYDKWKAQTGKARISERTLLLWAFLLGAFGAALGMLLFGHKTRKIVFITAIPLAILENLAIIHFFGHYFL